ncbi:hypothetical protein [Luteimonas sp. FCS-9]|uniref:hypothetical protein n=1 Tax=Luteimonas sp. FCS-9 TaxID=1547516 RepID=UPI00069C6DAE|nr:hypothetical protein [Luteimonas sp. FCS-9]
MNRPDGRLGLTRMAAPLAVWALHFVAVYSLQGLACARGLGRAPVAGLEAVTWALWALTLLALLGIAWSGRAAWRARHAAAAARPAGDRRHFLPLLTALVALVAAIGVVFTALPVALLPTCA